MKNFVFIVAYLLITSFSLPATWAKKPVVSHLRCEYKKDPIGINTQNPRLSWIIRSDEPNQAQNAFQVLVATSPSLLKPGKADLWNSEKMLSDQSILVQYDGKKLTSRQKCWWTVRIWDKNNNRSQWSEPAYFELGLLSPDDWNSNWINSDIDFEEYSYPAPLIRKEFALNNIVKSARLYCTSLGLYEFYLNGEKVGDQLFTPGWTSYDERLQYQTYDITKLLSKGRNAAGIMLGNGWYRAFRPNSRNARNIQDVKVLAQIEIEFIDGTTQRIITDDSWKSATGAILFSEIYDGEVYDGRLEKEGWKETGYNDRDWYSVEVSKEGKDFIVAPKSPPVRKIQELLPIDIIYTPEGDTVLDMGQNMVGWCRLKLNCPSGTTIKLRHAEVLDKEGNFYVKNLRKAKQQISYTCKGGGETEIYEPTFTFQGFRYVAVSGYPGEIPPDLITGIVIHSDLDRTGTFSCNDSLINQLQHNIIWGQKGNFVDVPTDCPQRDERLGWTGDAQVFAPTACFNMHCGGFFTKWLRDLAADQHEDGAVPWVVPNVLGRGEAHGWADAATIVPWILYRYYGDQGILEQQYESMKAWVDYVRDEAGPLYLWKPDERQFGDWLAFATTRSDYPGATTDKDLLATAYFYHSADLLYRTSKILGREDEAANYHELMGKIKDAFNDEYVTPNGRLSSNTQTAYVVSLSFGLLPEEKEPIAAARLAEDVNKFGHITTGFLGTPDICHVLTQYGYLDEAYMLLFREEYPSWLYPVKKGATTIWERWDGIKPDSSFQNPGMNSFNHYAYGAIGDWLYRKVAGIDLDPEVPAFKKFTIKPHPGDKMNDVKCSHESPYGTISSEWTVKNGYIKLRIQIPVNTTAKVYIPATEHSLKDNGHNVDITDTEHEAGLPYHFITLEKGSGSYVFEAPFKPEKAEEEL